MYSSWISAILAPIEFNFTKASVAGAAGKYNEQLSNTKALAPSDRKHRKEKSVLPRKMQS